MPKILIVDDSDVVAGILSQHLSESGYETVRAENGLAGIIAAYRESPDLIICDVEMPRLQGYQMSRLLKHRRAVKDIPIIMHTSLSEDRDRFWALNSGADDFINKDFDNLDRLVEMIRNLLARAPVLNRDLIREDSALINEVSTMEMLGAMFDRELFRSTIMNELAGVEKHISSLSQSALEILNLLTRICEAHISVLNICYGKSVQSYILPSEEIYRADIEDFRNISLADFRSAAGTGGDDFKESIFGIENRKDFDKIRGDHRRLSSYALFPLKGKGEEIIGTLHVGNLSNNYFSEIISDNIEVFARGVSMVLENAVLFNRISGMEKKIRNVFSKFVPPEVISDLLEAPEDNSEMKVGEKRSVAILFSDIRSFTVISENNSAENIVSALNQYFQLMVSEIRAQGGVVDKFIGDAILVIFGAPVSYEDNAARAVRAAAGMIKRLPEVPVRGLKLPEEGFNIGIGIHEGSVIVGNIGSQDKFDYTVIGDNVNLASRLEGLTKHYKRKIIISETVMKKTEQEFPVREIDRVKVKGKELSTTLFSVDTGQDIQLDSEAKEAYHKGIQLYRMQNWMTARDYFSKVIAGYPEDYLSAMYIKRCEQFSNTPPAEGEQWDGSVSLDFK